MAHLKKSLLLASILCMNSLCASAQNGAPLTDASAQRIQILEQRLAEMQKEIAALKFASSSPGSQTPALQNAVLTTTTVTAPKALVAMNPVELKAAPPPTLAQILGPVTLSGFVDTYYAYNNNHPTNRTNTYRSFDATNSQFALNMVEVVLDKTPDANASRTGYHVGLGFGEAMNAINASDPGGLGFAQYLKEAYFSYLVPVGKGLQIDVGKFVTPAGAEVIETKDNWNYSRGLLFSYAIPYYHFGARAKYTFSDKFSLTGYLVNGWNNVVDNNTGKTAGVSVAWNPTKQISIAQNYLAGPETTDSNSSWRQLSDTVLTYSPTSKLSFMTNYDYGRGDRMKGVASPVYWTGIAGYVRYTLNNKYAVASRYEYYNDHDGFTTGTAQHFNGITGTLQRAFSNHLIARIEFRREMSNQPTFVQGSENAVKDQNTATLGMVYTFATREQ